MELSKIVKVCLLSLYNECMEQVTSVVQGPVRLVLKYMTSEVLRATSRATGHELH